MNTGIKALDAVIARWGINSVETDNAFQMALPIRGRDPRVLSMKLPYCIVQEIGRHTKAETLTLHQFFVPHKKAKLACFVTDHEGNILERVYYGHDRKYWNASAKVANALAHAIAGNQGMVPSLAA